MTCDASLETPGSRCAGRPQGRTGLTFVRPDCPIIVTLAERRGPLPVPYVRMVIRALEECCDDE